jgi:hypothetical protein
MKLRFGQSKGLKTDYVVLVPGPDPEIKIVREIFSAFASRKKTRTEIANDLNERGIRNARGKPWSMLTIGNMLKNEVYLGHLVYNRTSAKLGERAVRNPRDMWIRRENAHQAIVPPKLFARAQEVRAELVNGRHRTDKEILNDLKALLRRTGRLTMKMMASDKKVPGSFTYVRRFGSITNAYKKIGYKPNSRYRFTEITADIDTTLRDVANNIISAMGKRRTNVTFVPEIYLLTLNRSLTVGMAVARAVRNGTGRGPTRRWEVRKLRYMRSELTLIVRMNSDNSKVEEYFLMPTSDLPICRDGRMRISDRYFGAFGYDDLGGVVKTLAERLSGGRLTFPTPA